MATEREVCFLTFTFICVFIGLIKCVKGQPVECDLPTSCKPGDLVSDPNNCQYYFECTSGGNTFKRRRCGKDKHYDTGTNRCRIPRNAKCATVCDSDVSMFNGLESSESDSPLNLLSEDNNRNKTDMEATLEPVIEESVNITNSEPKAGNGSSESAGNQLQVNDTVKPPIEDIAIKLNVSSTTISSSTSSSLAETTPELSTAAKAQATTETLTTVKATTEDVNVPTTAAEVIRPKVTTGSVRVTEGGPPYDVITKENLQSTTVSNNTGVPPEPVTGGLSTATIGIIAGVIGLVVIIVLVIIIIILVRRRRNRNRHDIPKIENPQYAAAAATKPTNYRFSRNSALYVGPTVNFQKLKSVPQDGDSLTRKKRPAPGVPPARQNLLRKKGPAPPPPGGFGDIEEERPLTDLYEKDSNGGSAENLEMSTFTARNDTAVLNTSDQAKDPSEDRDNSRVSATDPLLDTEKQTGSPEKVKDSVVRNGGIAEKTLNQEEPNNNKDEADDIEDSGKRHDPAEALFGPGKTGASKDNVSEDISLDDYDRAHNPFFS